MYVSRSASIDIHSFNTKDVANPITGSAGGARAGLRSIHVASAVWGFTGPKGERDARAYPSVPTSQTECPLSGVDRTSAVEVQVSAYDRYC